MPITKIKLFQLFLEIQPAKQEKIHGTHRKRRKLISSTHSSLP